jgi:hypothetical protein
MKIFSRQPKSATSPISPALLGKGIAVLSIAASAALAGCNNFSGDDKQQAQVISGFYDAHLKAHTPGIPAAEELKQYQPFVSHALAALLDQASAAEAKYHAAMGTQVPPIIEGDLFTSLFEGASSYRVESCDSQDNKASCQVGFEYKSQDGDREAWNDKILLVREDGHWRIDDIEFIGNDQSSQREYLSDTLSEAIKDAQ